jgi:hypothetical protein
MSDGMLFPPDLELNRMRQVGPIRDRTSSESHFRVFLRSYHSDLGAIRFHVTARDVMNVSPWTRRINR